MLRARVCAYPGRYIPCACVADDFDWSRRQGFSVVPAEECWGRSLAPLMARVREVIGPEAKTYLSFDIDSLDPAFAPGTGQSPWCEFLSALLRFPLRTGWVIFW